MTVLLLSLLLLGSDEWSFQPDSGQYRNRRTMERKSPEELYAHALAITQEYRAEEAVEILDLLVQHGPAADLRERALFTRGTAYWWGGQYKEAHAAYRTYLQQHPESTHTEEAKERAMRCALRLAEEGDPIHFLGLPVDLTSKTGTDLLREFLRLYPREKTTAQYYHLLGEFFLERNEPEEAEQEYQVLVDQYGSTPYAGRALIRLAEISEGRFRGIPYDPKPLRDARRHLDRFLEEYASREEGLAVRVREETVRIGNIQAEKDFEVGEYYIRRGYPKSALLCFQALQKNHPASPWAKRAGERIAELTPPSP